MRRFRSDRHSGRDRFLKTERKRGPHAPELRPNRGQAAFDVDGRGVGADADRGPTPPAFFAAVKVHFA